jgi:TRAP-type C4-dicarboxylate transport system permease small subunit
MSRQSGLSPRGRRAWAIGILIIFIVMCAMIAWSQWYAIHVNVPMYRAKHASEHRP